MQTAKSGFTLRWDHDFNLANQGGQTLTPLPEGLPSKNILHLSYYLGSNSSLQLDFTNKCNHFWMKPEETLLIESPCSCSYVFVSGVHIIAGRFCVVLLQYESSVVDVETPKVATTWNTMISPWGDCFQLQVSQQIIKVKIIAVQPQRMAVLSLQAGDVEKWLKMLFPTETLLLF